MPDRRSLPLVTFYLTERCNSRCITCDYWRHGRKDATLESVTRVLPDLRRLGTRVALLSGGEPLLNPEWRSIAATLRGAGISVWLLTSGLSLAKYATAASGLCESITVSLDGTNPATYRAIRGLDAYDKVCEGVRAAVALETPVNLRVTLQRANYRELPAFVAVARELGVRQVSFLAVDVGNAHAFARETVDSDGLALQGEDLPELARLIDTLEREQAGAFESRFIAESPDKLRRIHQYFAALLGRGPFPPVRCNAPEFSAVIGVDTRVAPCFFIPGPGVDTREGLSRALDDPALASLRAAIRAGARSECERCVCSMWREPGAFDAYGPRLQAVHA
jgi:MoaA/NifB/PqqE/SkfB family radical SAM enzyme